MSKRTITGFGIFAGIIVLAGAAYLGTLLITRSKSTATRPPEAIVIDNGNGISSSVQENNMDISPAPEIPKIRPIVRGAIMVMNDNQVLVGANPKVTAIGHPDGSAELKFEADGPLKEVILTGRTRIYRETTFDANDHAEEIQNGIPIQQTVEEITLADIHENRGVVVWGQQRGDRITADTVLYIDFPPGDQ